MEQEAFRRLLRRYAEGSCSQEEIRFLEDLILRDPVVEQWEWSSEEERLLMGLRIKRAVDKQRLARKKIGRSRWWGIGVAASLLLIGGAGWFIASQAEANHPVVISETSPFPTDGIRLTLADGSVVSLDSLQNGYVDKKDGKQLAKLDDGKLTYVYGSHQPTEIQETIQKNTIHVPNGKQFQVTLPDGTTVWMNTASSLTYPVLFSGSERRVQLEGEAYFDIAKDASRPFKVQTKDGTEVVATGTEFNVSAYSSDGVVAATLVEGGINVRKQGREISLTPGYQVLVSESGGIERRKGNLNQILAWREGYFVFDDMDVLAVMRSVARWYDVQVEVGTHVPQQRFGGSFPVNAGIDELLTDLALVGKIKFERKGKEVRIIW
ncbi:FecR family protein [Parapedobacter indicus]|uniref:FecR family protein n=1 Tax=Parapedobacter indicus TaxID=1477437 RepID=A0A1I3ETD2_9SPHI|nr:FecR domain-containing protein [Parapedobacter indicus]PPL03402.1 FecR family protein [Parapedobacter indicus]SFI02226.1 FecR family protein [Parapedobacter indicus]